MLSPFYTNTDTPFSASEFDSSALLKELDKIRAEIENDIVTSPVSLSVIETKNKKPLFSTPELNIENCNNYKNIPPFENYEKEKKENPSKQELADEVSQLVAKYKKRQVTHNNTIAAPTPKQPQILENPMVIPIRPENSPTTSRQFHKPHKKQTRANSNNLRKNDNFSPDFQNNLRQDFPENQNKNTETLSPITWAFLSYYESETKINVFSFLGSTLFFVGGGITTCGIVMMFHALLSVSKNWTIYELLLLISGILSLIFGKVFHLLSEKMRQINELKQTLTTQQIHIQSIRETNSAEKRNIQKQNSATKNKNAQTFQTVYHRLVELKSEVNELIDKCRDKNV